MWIPHPTLPLGWALILLVGVWRVAGDGPPHSARARIVRALRLVDESQFVPQVADTFGARETTIYRCLSAAEAAGLLGCRSELP